MKYQIIYFLLLICFISIGCKQSIKPTKEVNKEIIIATPTLDSALILSKIDSIEIATEPLSKNDSISESTKKEVIKIIQKTKSPNPKIQDIAIPQKPITTKVVLDSAINIKKDKEIISLPYDSIKISKKKEVKTIKKSNDSPNTENQISIIIDDYQLVPEKYIKLKNPTNPKEYKAIGKNLYAKHCKACHGKEGYGDGPKAADQKGDLGDFSSIKTQSQTDGALFYKITTGKDDMPTFKKKINDDEDRWLIVNYLRTLAE